MPTAVGETRNSNFMPKLQNYLSQVSLDEQEQSMLSELNPKLLADYELLKEKGDDVRVYLDEKKYISQKA